MAKKKKNKTGHIKVVSAGLKGFVDWTDLTVSESTEEREAEMSSYQLKRAASTQGETTPSSEGPDGKCLKPASPVEEVQINPTMISVDSPDRAPGALPAMEGDAQGASRETCTLKEDGALARDPPLSEEVTREVLPIEEASDPPPRARRPSLALFRAQEDKAT